MQLLKSTQNTHRVILIIILILSTYVHLWNPVGFPDIFFDEGIYMRRAMNVIETGNPQETYFYDHPYFGQILLAGILKLVGFPDLLDNNGVIENLELSYMVPRIIMGLFAVLDTFLLYHIARKKFGRNIAILAAILFALMPVTWLFRRILLDSLLMPFLLSSILLALYSQDSRNPRMLVLGSSALLGLAIFTKVTAVTMMPLIAYIIISGRGFRALYSWLPAPFAIPMIWPGYALSVGHLDKWLGDVFWQAGRGESLFFLITIQLFAIDPIMAGLGFASIVFAAYRRNLLLILWFVPFLLFVGTVGYFQYFHYMLILPAMCIGIGLMLSHRIQKTKSNKLQKRSFMVVTAGFAVYGLIVSSVIIGSDVTHAQFEALGYSIDAFDDKSSSLIASPVYTWVFSYILDKQNVFLDYGDLLYQTNEQEYVYLIVDHHFISDLDRGDELAEILNGTKSIKTFSVDDIPDTNYFPNQSFLITKEGYFIDIRTDEER